MTNRLLGLLLVASFALSGCGEISAALQDLGVWPTRYVVQRGDTLGKIAKAHGVTVDQLRKWNGISGDLIEVDQVLSIWDPDDGGLTATTSSGSRPSSRPNAPAAPQGTADAPKRIAIEINGLPGILGTQGPSGDVGDLEAAASRLSRSGDGEAGSGLQARGQGLGGTGSAEALDNTAFARTPSPQPTTTPGTPRVPSLKLPPRKACLAGPTDVKGDQGVAVSQGLSESQIREGLATVTSDALACFEGARGRFELGLSIVVACDGRVDRVDVTDPGGLPNATAACVQTTLRHAAFDAHARPDGVTFALPLSFDF
ncbi:MAG: LysM peptidoglycan-binding domain-containing protein [Myxococcota bacterium]